MADKYSSDKDAKSDEEMDIDDQNTDLDLNEEGGLRVDDDIYIPPPARSIAEVDVNGPRLMITKIVNQNFKSYANTQVIGPFHKCFSAIVGPNGSGKSNVIDSMLFVFGYRASKIRSKKISVLIHNSSEYPNINSCTVSVHFQKIIDKPGADYEVVPNSEFVISRTAFKDNSSYYEVNKKRVPFKEISILLRSHGVDLTHNRFLILQGEVEEIATMKPKGENENDTGMLEFLEDIIGTVRYKEPVEKLSEKLEALTEIRVEKLNRLRIVQREKEALEKQMQEAVQYLNQENEITEFQHKIYQCKRYQTTKESNELEKDVNELDQDLTNLINEMKGIQEEKEEKNKVIKEKSKKWNKLQQQKDECTANFEKIRKQDELLHAELVETNKRRKANTASVKTEKSKLEELQRMPEKNMKDIEQCEALVEKHTADKAKEEENLATLMAGLREKTEPLLEKRSQLEKKLISLKKNVNEAQGAFDIANSELEIYTSVEHTEKEQLEKLKESLKTTVSTLSERKKQLASLKTKIPASEESLMKAHEELGRVKSREVEVTAQLKNMRITFDEKRSAMQASRSRNKILDSLMQEKREGRIPGIFGRLGDLGAIDSKYDVAISTACGPLDNIVVDTVGTAEACISFLRHNDIGRATFIPLEKHQHLIARCNRQIQTPENVPRLFDLIRVEDERVLPAFYYGLQDTLVADNLDQATRIAYGQKRYRVVTLKGELIELSGTMSGGGNTVLKGRMGQKVVRNEPSAADIEKLQADLDVVFEECNHLRARQQPLEDQIYTLSAALNDMKVDKEKFNIEVQTLQEQEPSLRMQLKAQEKKAAESVSDPKKVKRLQQTVDEAKKHLDQVTEDAKSVENEVSRINRAIDEVAGGRVNDQQKKITNLKKAIDKAKAEICRLQVAIKTVERDVKKTEQRITTLEKDIETCEQRIRDIQKDKQGLEEQAKIFLDELSELAEALVGRDEAMSSLKEEMAALQAREDKMKSVKVDLEQKLGSKKRNLRELRQKIPEYTRTLNALKLQPIPGEPPKELKELTDEELSELDEKVVTANFQKAKKRLPTEIPNMQVISEFQDKNTHYLKRAAEFQEITDERTRIRNIYETARRRRIQEFLQGFSIISEKLKEMYRMITLGGDAELELVDSLDPFSEGIVFSVRPPKKSWKNICNLSGGEKTLSSLALVFALHHYKPTPLYFMDEIDAALDFKNVSIVANYIKQRTKNAQFIVISLRSEMFELADYLVGIYKTYNCTKCCTVDVAKFYEKHNIVPPTQTTSSADTYASQVQKLTVKNSQKQRKESRATQNEDNVQVCTQQTQQTIEINRNNNNTLSSPQCNLSPPSEESAEKHAGKRSSSTTKLTRKKRRT